MLVMVRIPMRSIVPPAALLLAFSPMLLADGQPPPNQQQLEQMSAGFATVDIGADVSALPASERKVLAKLVEASHLIDAIFLRQVWAGNVATLMRPRGRSVAARPRAAELFPAEQGRLVAHRSEQAVPGGRPRGKAPARATSIPPAPRRPRSSTGLPACRPTSTRRPPASSRRSAAPLRARRSRSSSCRTASSIRASSPRRPRGCAKPRRSRRSRRSRPS